AFNLPLLDPLLRRDHIHLRARSLQRLLRLQKLRLFKAFGSHHGHTNSLQRSTLFTSGFAHNYPLVCDGRTRTLPVKIPPPRGPLSANANAPPPGRAFVQITQLTSVPALRSPDTPTPAPSPAAPLQPSPAETPSAPDRSHSECDAG